MLVLSTTERHERARERERNREGQDGKKEDEGQDWKATRLVDEDKGERKSYAGIRNIYVRIAG